MITPQFVLAILFAFTVFGATLSSVARMLTDETLGRKALRAAHLAIVLCVISVMGSLSAVSEGAAVLGVGAATVAIAVGYALIAACVAAILLETGTKRLIPIPLAILGALVASGAPFT